MIKLEFGNVGFSGEKKTREPAEKPTTNSSHMTQGYNRTWTTLVGGKHSHHCTNPAPLNFPFQSTTHNPVKLSAETKATENMRESIRFGEFQLQDRQGDC